jgi:hypothetical protein
MPLHTLVGVAVVLATSAGGIIGGRYLGSWLGRIRRNRRRHGVESRRDSVDV